MLKRIIEKYLIYVEYLIGAIKGHKINYLIIRSKRYLYQYWMSFFSNMWIHFVQNTRMLLKENADESLSVHPIVEEKKYRA